jgi:uncharacterized RDD family membrane protein YckC
MPVPTSRPEAPFVLDHSVSVLGRRFVAYCLDAVILLALVIAMTIAIFLFGIITFGLGWLLFAILVPGTAIGYTALTLGGASQATIGMAMTGLQGQMIDGERIDTITAAAHALLFYVAAMTVFLWIVDILFGFARADQRLGHDWLTRVILLPVEKKGAL